MKMGKSITVLRSGWMILAFILLAVTLLATNWYYYDKTKKNLDDEFSERLKVLASLVAKDISRVPFDVYKPLTTGGKVDSLTRVLEGTSVTYSISNIIIVREDGILIYTLKPGILVPGEPYPHWNMDYDYIISALEGETASTELYKAPDGNFLKAGYAPLKSRGEEIRAVVCVEASAGFLAGLNELRKILLLATVISIAGIILFMSLAIKATTSLLQARESLMRSETLASMGRMAAGIAHEIRNPLFIIRSSAETLKNENPELSERIDEYIIEEVDRLNDVLSDYLLFARDESAVKRPMDLVKTLSRSVRLIREDAENRGVEIKMDISIAEAPFTGEEKRLQQAFLNILLNSLQAIDGRGTIWVRMKRNGGRYTIEFEDNGRGIGADEMKKIFEPFYTTKPDGSGLGLSIVKAIVESHGAAIEISSKDGKGTKVTLRFPLTGKAQTEMVK